MLPRGRRARGPPRPPLLYEAKWVLRGRGGSGGSGASLPDHRPILDVIDHACPNASTPTLLPRRTPPFLPPRVTSTEILEKGSWLLRRTKAASRHYRTLAGAAPTLCRSG